MCWKRLTYLSLTTILVMSLANPLSATARELDLGFGIIKRIQGKSSPATRVKELTHSLRTDQDDKKRREAALELRSFDPRQYPDIVPALINSLQKDPVPAVRIVAVESLSKLKPVSQPAGLAMEAALTSEPDGEVREAIKSALWQYSLQGYRTPVAGSSLATQSAEPKFAAKPNTTRAKATTDNSTLYGSNKVINFQPIRNLVSKQTLPPNSTPEPPLAKGKLPPTNVPTTPTPPTFAPAKSQPTAQPLPSLPLPEIPTVEPVPAKTPAATVEPANQPDLVTPSGLPLPTIPVAPVFPLTPTKQQPPTETKPLVPVLPPLPDKD